MHGNPVYQQLRVSLAEAEATVAQLRTRVAEYEARYAQLKESAKLVPQMEAEYTQLNRDYGVHKRNYETLVAPPRVRRRSPATWKPFPARISG